MNVHIDPSDEREVEVLAVGVEFITAARCCLVVVAMESGAGGVGP